MIELSVQKQLGEAVEQGWVVVFLTRFKEFASSNGIVVFRREDYVETLGELGILPHQAEEIILGLTLENYYKGAGEGGRERG